MFEGQGHGSKFNHRTNNCMGWPTMA